MDASAFEDGGPFCTRCGLLLRGHESAAHCPDCGAALPAALGTNGPSRATPGARCVRRESSARLLGWPLVSIAIGPDPERGERVGRARGVIAVGDVAIGGVAVGGVAMGVVAVGGVAVGVSAAAGVAVGLLASLGSVSAGGCAVGGVALGGLVTGGCAVGYAAQGGAAVGVYARGGGVAGAHTISAGVADSAARQVFDTLTPVMGAWPPAGTIGSALTTAVGTPLAVLGVLAAIIGAVVLIAQRNHEAARRRRAVLFNGFGAGGSGHGGERGARG